MRPPADGWDRDEREALEPLGDELIAMRARHASDPSLELLRAASADALPGDLQAHVSEHLSESAWSRALVAGANDVEHSLDKTAEDRLLARITAAADTRPRRWINARQWLPLLATAAAVTIVTTVLLLRRDVAPPPSGVVSTKAAPAASAPPTVARAEPRTVELPLRQPDVRVSVAALTWRGPSGGSSLVDDLAPALDAFRQADYARAADALARLEGRYPDLFDARFYRGISLLFLNESADAIDELQKAARLADGTFSSDVAWYLAIAEQRAGNTAAARARLDTLCRTANAYTADACDGLKKLDGAR